MVRLQVRHLCLVESISSLASFLLHTHTRRRASRLTAWSLCCVTSLPSLFLLAKDRHSRSVGVLHLQRHNSYRAYRRSTATADICRCTRRWLAQMVGANRMGNTTCRTNLKSWTVRLGVVLCEHWRKSWVIYTQKLVAWIKALHGQAFIILYSTGRAS